MKVQELINKLEKVKKKNLQIVIRGTDPTDFLYHNEIEGLSEENIFYQTYDGDEFDFYYRRRFVIDGGLF